MLPAGNKPPLQRELSFAHKSLATAHGEKKGLRHIAAARKYNREELRLDLNLASRPLIQIKPAARNARHA